MVGDSWTIYILRTANNTERSQTSKEGATQRDDTTLSTFCLSVCLCLGRDGRDAHEQGHGGAAPMNMLR